MQLESGGGLSSVCVVVTPVFSFSMLLLLLLFTVLLWLTIVLPYVHVVIFVFPFIPALECCYMLLMMLLPPPCPRRWQIINVRQPAETPYTHAIANSCIYTRKLQKSSQPSRYTQVVGDITPPGVHLSLTLHHKPHTHEHSGRECAQTRRDVPDNCHKERLQVA